MYIAACDRRLEVVKYLVEEARVNPHGYDSQGRSVLYYVLKDLHWNPQRGSILLRYLCREVGVCPSPADFSVGMPPECRQELERARRVNSLFPLMLGVLAASGPGEAAVAVQRLRGHPLLDVQALLLIGQYL